MRLRARFYAICSAAVVFILWDRTEHTLSIHTIDTPRREGFYWAAVVATFATGTAVGDLTATTFHLGYFHSALLLRRSDAHSDRRLLGSSDSVRRSPPFTLDLAYVLTRPLGASVADWLGKSKAVGGLNAGDGVVAVCFFLAIVALVALLTITGHDVPGRARSREHASNGRGRRDARHRALRRRPRHRRR